MSNEEFINKVCYNFICDRLENEPQNNKWFRAYYPHMPLEDIRELSKLTNEPISTLINDFGFGRHKILLSDMDQILLEEGKGEVLQKVYQAAA